ncbi:MAG: DNA-deoxyinosine glycosylase [Puniceicoccales bacterium]|jgi:hypoxanthine-DNA glycosylase|nr:DNA-deoxyinosine glycosylase [Puniceicoccales bacterium]
MAHFEHPFDPVFNEKSEILILGTFPSSVSRERAFFYAHPQNRFWKIMAYFTKTRLFLNSIDEKKSMLLENKIALWDAIKSCDIEGSSDSRIANVVPVDLSPILENAPIKHIFTNGAKAHGLYGKYFSQSISLPATKLPSTSPANASYKFERLLTHWNAILI